MEMRRASYLGVSFRITGTFGKHLGVRVSGQMTVARTSWLGLNFSLKFFCLKGDQSYSFWKTHCRRTKTSVCRNIKSPFYNARFSTSNNDFLKTLKPLCTKKCFLKNRYQTMK